jgi:hypothetical protein
MAVILAESNVGMSSLCNLHTRTKRGKLTFRRSILKEVSHVVHRETASWGCSVGMVCSTDDSGAALPLMVVASLGQWCHRRQGYVGLATPRRGVNWSSESAQRLLRNMVKLIYSNRGLAWAVQTMYPSPSNEIFVMNQNFKASSA